MNRPKVIQLLDDFAVGGVVKVLAFYDQSPLATKVDSRTLPVQPNNRLAPHFECDLIITHFTPNWRRIPYLWSLRLRNRRARIVHIEHSYTRAWEAQMVPEQDRFRLMLRIAYAATHAVVAVSEAQGRWLSEATGLAAPKLRVIHPWSGKQGLEKLAIAKSGKGTPIILGAYGRFAHAKGFDVLIDAMRLLPAESFRLLLGGFGAEESMLRARAADLPHVEFYGRVDDVADFIGRCDAIVVPSRWEAFGQVAAEAKLGGRPIIVADVDGLPEQAKRTGIVVDCTKPTALAGAIKSLTFSDLAMMASNAKQSMIHTEALRLGSWQCFFGKVITQHCGRARATRALHSR